MAYSSEQRQDHRGGVGQAPAPRCRRWAGLDEQLLPQECEAEAVGAQQLGQRHPLLGAAPAGAPRRPEVRIVRCGHRAEHEREVVAHRPAQFGARDDRVGSVEVDLGGDAIDEPLDQVVEPPPRTTARPPPRDAERPVPTRCRVAAAGLSGRTTDAVRPSMEVDLRPADPHCMDLDNRIGDSLYHRLLPAPRGVHPGAAGLPAPAPATSSKRRCCR